jgi:hypothetical protein
VHLFVAMLSTLLASCESGKITGPLDMTSTIAPTPTPMAPETLGCTAASERTSSGLKGIVPTFTPAPITVSEVTSVQVTSSLSSYSGSCPTKNIVFTGTLTAEKPGLARYQWEHSSGGLSNVRTVVFSEAGLLEVTFERSFSNSDSGWYRIRILTPNTLVSNKADYSVSCEGKVTKAEVHAISYEGECPQTITAVGYITTDGPATVNYIFVREDRPEARYPGQITVACAGRHLVTREIAFDNDSNSKLGMGVWSPNVVYSNVA